MPTFRNLFAVSAAAVLFAIILPTTPCLAQSEPRVDRAPSQTTTAPPAGRGQAERDRRAERPSSRAGRSFLWRQLDFSNLFERDFAHRDLDVISQHLDLHSGQRSILQVLLEEYLDAYEAEVYELRQAIAEIEESREAAREQLRQELRAMQAQLRDNEPPSIALTDAEGEPVVVTLDGREVHIAIGRGFRIMAEDSDGSVEMDRSSLTREDRARLREAAREHLREIDPDTRNAMRDRMRERRDRARAVREEMREMRQQALAEAEEEGPGPEHLEQPANAFLAAKRTLREQMNDDIRLILNDQQAEHWERVEMLRYRLRELPRGEYPGERVDVARMIDDLSLPSLPEHESARVLENYETKLDRALRDRQRFLELADIKRAKATLQSEYQDHRRLRFEEQRHRSAVSRVNQDTFDQLVALCTDPDDAEKLRQVKREQMFPEVYRPTRATRAYQYAMNMEDLDADQRDAVDAQYDLFHRQLNTLNKQRVEALEAMRDAREAHLDEMMERMEAGEAARFERTEEMRRGGEAYRELRDEHRQLVQQFIDSLAGVLGDRHQDVLDFVGDAERQADRRGRRAWRDGRMRLERGDDRRSRE